jgi:hypothetical protein
MTDCDATVTRAMDVIRAEYRDSPGLCLTQAQVKRLCSLDTSTCEAALFALVSAGILRCSESGAYVRADEGNEVPCAEAAARFPRPFSRVK